MAEVTDSNPFDLTRIRQLVRLMRENDLAEIDLRWQHSRLRLRRGAENVVLTNVSPAPQARAGEMGAAGVNADTAAGGAPAAAASKAADTSNLLTITSPIVGTFYRSPSPETDAFVSPGSKVRTDTVVCIIEAMKVFNEIPAGMAGTIREVLVENGAPVEYGQPLFRLEP